MMLPFKNFEKEDIRNYHLFSLPQALNKIFMKVLTNHLQKQLDVAQPNEQAGFR